MAFSTRRFVKHIDKYDKTHRIEIQEDGFGGSESKINARRPVFEFEHETHTGGDEEILSIYENPVQKGSLEVYLDINDSTDETLISDIFSGDEDDFRLVWKVDGTVFWTGTILNDMLEYPESGFPYQAIIRAKDFSRLEGVDYTLDDTRQTLIATFADLLSNLSYGLDIETHTSWITSDTTDATDFLQQIYHETKALRRFARTGDESDETITVYEALEMMCRNFGLVCRQEGGVFKLIQYSEYETPTGVNVTVYDSSGSEDTAASSTDLSLDGSTNDIILTDRSITRTFKGIKRDVVTFQHRAVLVDQFVPSNVTMEDTDLDQQYSQDYVFDGNQELRFRGRVSGVDFSDPASASVIIDITIGNYDWDSSSQSWIAAGSIDYDLTKTNTNTFSRSFDIQTDPVPNDATGPVTITLQKVTTPSGTADITTYSDMFFEVSNPSVEDGDTTAIRFQLTQTGIFSSTYDMGETWFGDGPVSYAVSALRYDSGDGDLTDGSWQRRGTTSGYRNLHQNLLKEALDIQRSNIHRTDGHSLGADYDPESILSYRSMNMAYTGGVFDGDEGDWHPVLMEIDVQTGSDTFSTISEYTEGATIGTGSTSGSSGGGGLDQTTADNRYLKLDTSNDPLTGDLSIGSNAFTAGTVEIGSNWKLDSATEGGTERLRLQAVGVNDAAELFLQAKGSANASRVTLTPDASATNYSFVTVESNGTSQIIDSGSEGTESTLPLSLRIDGTEAIGITTGRQVNINGQRLFNLGEEQALGTGDDVEFASGIFVSDEFRHGITFYKTFPQQNVSSDARHELRIPFPNTVSSIMILEVEVLTDTGSVSAQSYIKRRFHVAGFSGDSGGEIYNQSSYVVDNLSNLASRNVIAASFDEDTGNSEIKLDIYTEHPREISVNLKAWGEEGNQTGPRAVQNATFTTDVATGITVPDLQDAETPKTVGFTIHNDASIDDTLTINGTPLFDVGKEQNLSDDATGVSFGDLTLVSGAIETDNFTSGWQGTGHQTTYAGNLEAESMFLRGGLTVNELILNRLHYQDGGLIIGAGGGKVASVSGSAGSETVTFEDPEGNTNLPFSTGAIVMLQDFDLDRTTVVKKIVREVSSITGSDITLTTTTGWTTVDDVGSIAVGDEMVAIGHVSNTDRDAFIYMSAVDQNNPFLRVMDGVDAYNKFTLGSQTGLRVQLGNLNGIAGFSTDVFGVYAKDNVVLELDGGNMNIGKDVGGASVDGIHIDSNDYWYTDGTGSVGDGILNWDASVPEVEAAGWLLNATSITGDSGNSEVILDSASPRLWIRNTSNNVSVTLGRGFWDGSTQDEVGFALAPNFRFGGGDPYVQFTRNITSGDLTAQIAGIDFDESALSTGDGSIGSYTAGTVTGLQKRTSSTTRTFFSGSDDNSGTNANFYVLPNGKIFHDAVGGSIYARLETASFTNNADASSITDQEYQTTVSSTTNGITTDRDTKVRTVALKRFGADTLIVSGYGRSDGDANSGATTTTPRARIYVKVTDLETSATNEDSATLSSGSGHFNIELDISTLTDGNNFLIEVDAEAEIEISGADGATYNGECYLREDVFIQSATI